MTWHPNGYGWDSPPRECDCSRFSYKTQTRRTGSGYNRTTMHPTSLEPPRLKSMAPMVMSKASKCTPRELNLEVCCDFLRKTGNSPQRAIAFKTSTPLIRMCMVSFGNELLRLSDFDDFGGGFVSGITEFGEVVAAECEFQKECLIGNRCLEFPA